MPAEFEMKANDRRPSIEATLGFQGSALPEALTGSVTFIMRRANLATGAGSTPTVTEDPPKVDAAATIVDGALWKVRYDWLEGDTDEPGTYLAEWEVSFGDGAKQTFPTTGYHWITIYPDLDGS